MKVLGLGTIFVLIILTNVATWLITAQIMANKNVSIKTLSIPTAQPILKSNTFSSINARPLGEYLDIGVVPQDVLQNPTFREQHLTVSEDYKLFYFNDKQEYQRVTYNDHPISSVLFAPGNRSQLGFFYYPNGDHISEIALIIMDIKTQNFREVYRDDIRTSNWEWASPNHVIVYYNCGTACRYAHKIDVKTGKEVNGWHVITDYTPPPWPEVDRK